MAGLILALWFSAAHSASGPLAILVRSYRQSPTAAHRAAVRNYGAAHPREAPLVALALGVTAYEQRDYATAIAQLAPLPAKLPAIADSIHYYLAAARVESGDMAAVARDTAAVRSQAPISPLASRSWILEARSLKPADPKAAIQLLLAHYAELPQPETDINLADFYLAANQPIDAANYYQRVYYGYLNGDAARRAAEGIAGLKQQMGDSYPAPTAALRLRHADLLLAAGEYNRAADEYGAIPLDVARVRAGVADLKRGAVTTACPYLRDLSLPEGEADAERMYYLTECARRRDDEEALRGTLERMAARYPKSAWRLRALTSAANHYIVANRADDYVPLERVVYREFPASPGAAVAHWKVTFQAWLRNQPDAGALLREHLEDYSGHTASAGAALYFLGRSLERERDFAGARACYQRLAAVFENHYYAMLALDRLRGADVAQATGTSAIAPFLARLKFPSPPPIPQTATAATSERIRRSRVLRAAGLYELADSELRFGARGDGQPALLAMELAAGAEEIHQGLRAMKSLNPDYLEEPLAAGPRRFWELLFPLPYKSDLVRWANAHSLDPYLLAGLIRQESEFNPKAISRARAYGLTQILPGTGRQYARREGVRPFSTRLLSQPATNLRLGSSIFKSMLDTQGGSVEQTLAAYNAGPNRVADWITWATYREPAEFVENIPFTETRDYVQAVLRNADIYRRLYR
ncbi:MAG: lytic transglycosylase domain-containing protein [Acidobacteriota bacterium]|nr:lytic transglycosylase domain-containing protein [Acidobacteriota bacterium]